MPRTTAPAFCNFLYASRNPDASIVQPGVSALGKKNRTTVLPRKLFSETFRPSSSGKVKSGALSFTSMEVSPHRAPLYRSLRQAASAAFAILLLAGLVSAQFARKATLSKGPRALGLLELAANGKAHLVPIVIMWNGKFYDASSYKADPVPMALESGTV